MAAKIAGPGQCRQGVRSGLQCTAAQVTSASSAAYWEERWELYKYVYYTGVWAYDHYGAPKAIFVRREINMRLYFLHRLLPACLIVFLVGQRLRIGSFVALCK